jgi:hypothetical protein
MRQKTLCAQGFNVICVISSNMAEINVQGGSNMTGTICV